MSSSSVGWNLKPGGRGVCGFFMVLFRPNGTLNAMVILKTQTIKYKTKKESSTQKQAKG